MSTIKIALTVDDLPIHGDKITHCSRLEIIQYFTQAFKKFYLPPVVGFANMKAAFLFSEGQAIIEHWNETGNILANHTFTHLDLENVSEGEFIFDIEKNEKHLSMFPQFERYFRFPFLSESMSFKKRIFLREYLIRKNYTVVPVTIDFHDFMWNTPFSKCLTHQKKNGSEYLRNTFLTAASEAVEQSSLVSQSLFSYDIKHIMLIHAGMATAFFIESLIECLQEKGVSFISLDEALSDEIYENDFYTPERNGENFLEQAALACKFPLKRHSELLKRQVLRYAYNLPSTISI